MKVTFYGQGGKNYFVLLALNRLVNSVTSKNINSTSHLVYLIPHYSSEYSRYEDYSMSSCNGRIIEPNWNMLHYWLNNLWDILSQHWTVFFYFFLLFFPWFWKAGDGYLFIDVYMMVGRMLLWRTDSISQKTWGRDWRFHVMRLGPDAMSPMCAYWKVGRRGRVECWWWRGGPKGPEIRQLLPTAQKKLPFINYLYKTFPPQTRNIIFISWNQAPGYSPSSASAY